MAARLQDYTAETIPAPGTGAITLPGTPTAGGKTFANSYANGDTVFYQIIAGSQLEMGLGTFNNVAGTLARTTVYWNSAGTTSPLNIVVTCVCVAQIAAQKGAWYDSSRLIQVSQQPSVQQDIVQVLRSDGTFKWGSHVQARVWTPIAWDTVVSNGLGISVAGATTFTIPTDGIYRLFLNGSINGSNIGAANGGIGAASQNCNAVVGFFLDGVELAECCDIGRVTPQVGTVAGNNMTNGFRFDSYMWMNYVMFATAGQILSVQAMCIPAKASDTSGGWYGSMWNNMMEATPIIGGASRALGPSEFRIMRLAA